MLDIREVVFKIKVDHKKVKEAYEKAKKGRRKQNEIDEQIAMIFEALLRSQYIYVPESQLARFIDYGEVITK